MGQRQGCWSAIQAVQSAWTLVPAITEVLGAIAVVILCDFPDRNHSPDFSSNFPPFYSVLLHFTRFYSVFLGFPRISSVFLPFPRISPVFSKNLPE
jgi:hypothetical protein